MKNKLEKGNSVVGGLFWTFGERITAQLVTVIVTIVLARILAPEHYGIISIVTVFISLCNIFVSSGFGSAVVQKKNATDDDFNTAFVISFTISILLYLILFFLSPYIANFYHMPDLVMVLRVMGIRLIIASLNTIQHAYIQRQMKFKKFFFATLFGTVLSAIVGIILAYLNFGVWALVAQYLINTTVDTIVLAFVCKWKVRFYFNLKKAKVLFSFGWKVLCTELIFTLESDIRSLIVGKVFGSADLAYYDQGRKYPSLFVTNINSSITKVMLPAFSKEQDDIEKLKKMLQKSVKVSTYALAPLLIGFALLSDNFILIFLTEKWLPAVPYVQIFCLVFLTRPFENSCHQALLAIGKSGIVMKIMLAINIFALFTVLFAVFILKSVYFIAVGSLLTAVVSLSLFMIMVSIKIGYKILDQIHDIFPPICISLIMGIFVYLIGMIKLPLIILLTLQILIGAIIYLLLSVKFKIYGYIYLKDRLFHIIRKVKGVC